MILKHRDREVVRFDWVEPFGVKNVEVNPAEMRYLPLEMQAWVRKGPAPIFDNGRGLFSKIDDLGEPSKGRGTPPHPLEPALLDRWLAIPGGITEAQLARLEQLRNFVFIPDTYFNLPAERVKMIQYLMRNRIENILRYKEKADKKLKIAKKSDTINAQKKTDLDQSILDALKLIPSLSRERLAEMYSVGPATIVRHLKKLQQVGRLRRVGSRKTGHWEIV